MSKAVSIYVKLERLIATDERGGVEHRFEYGSELLKARAGRQRLPKGYLAERIAEAERAGLPPLSEQEMQRRMRFAEVYPTKAHRRQILTLKGSWSAIVNDNFPEVTVDETPPVGDVLDDIEGGAGDPQEFEQPGLFPDLVKKIPLPVSPLRHLVAYAEEMRGMTASYAKRDDERQAHLQELTIAAGGDLDVTYQDALAMLRAKQMAAAST